MYVTIFNQRLNVNGAIMTVEADSPEKFVYLHIRERTNGCDQHPGCMKICNDAHHSLTWEQAQELSDALAHVLPYDSVEHALADRECDSMMVAADRQAADDNDREWLDGIKRRVFGEALA